MLRFALKNLYTSVLFGAKILKRQASRRYLVSIHRPAVF
jgi:hypothetical protein